MGGRRHTPGAMTKQLLLPNSAGGTSKRRRKCKCKQCKRKLQYKYNLQPAKDKCGGLSTAAASAPPSVEMTHFGGWAEKINTQIPFGDDNKKKQEQRQPTLCDEAAKGWATQLRRWATQLRRWPPGSRLFVPKCVRAVGFCCRVGT